MSRPEHDAAAANYQLLRFGYWLVVGLTASFAWLYDILNFENEYVSNNAMLVLLVLGGAFYFLFRQPVLAPIWRKGVISSTGDADPEDVGHRLLLLGIAFLAATALLIFAGLLLSSAALESYRNLLVLIALMATLAVSLRSLGPRVGFSASAIFWLGGLSLIFYWRLALIALVVGAVATGKLRGEQIASVRAERTVRSAAAIACAAMSYQVALGLVGVPFLYPLGIIVAVVATGVVLVRRRQRGEPYWRRHALQHTGLLAALILAVLTLTAYAGYAENTLNESGLRAADIGRGGPPFPRPADPLQLAQAYQPFLVHTTDEKWEPMSAASYLRQGSVYLEGRKVKGTALERCKEVGNSCIVTISCADPDALCAKDRLKEQRVIYARVVPDPLAAEGFKASDVRGTVLEGVTNVVQYWAFYRYNDWRSWIADRFRFWHEGDWEWVAVGLRPSGPSFVAFSSHCGGRWRSWDRVAAIAGRRLPDGTLQSDSNPPPGHHVVAFAGEGSHAMYPDARRTAPNWTSCRKNVPKLFYLATWGPTHATAVTEKLNERRHLEDPLLSPRLVLADENTPPEMALRAYWSEGNHQRTVWGGGCLPAYNPPPKQEDDDERCTPTAQAPALQAPWTAPLRTIFCSPYFLPRGRIAACP